MVTIVTALLAVLTPTAAAAVVGGAPDQGPLARATVMVLKSNGAVCTGLVVAPDAVLTAAHCATGAPEIRVHFMEAGAPVLIEPSAKAVHPGYDANAPAARRRSIDLALLRLPAPLTARFATAALTAAPVPSGTPLRLGGYGLAREGEPKSTGTFRVAALTLVEPHGPSRILVWARGGRGVGACYGDSGGPITRDADASVFALTTWAKGSGQANCGDISQGVLLGPQRPWIDRVLAGWGRAAVWE